jgi:hypothetical protein
VVRPVEQIADWLEKLGLGQYAKVFADNDIDVSVLPHLTDQDLKDLGISLGHRRKIFAAINEVLLQFSRSPKPREPKSTPSKRPPSAAT